MVAIDLAEDFGRDSPTARMGVGTLYLGITETATTRARTFLDGWKTFFKGFSGYRVEDQNDIAARLGADFGISDPQPASLLFSLQTYYAILLKVLAAKITAPFSPVPPVPGPPAEDMTNQELREEMLKLEGRGSRSTMGIGDFPGEDPFRWYLDAWDGRVADVMRNILLAVGRYEPASLSGKPGDSRDLLKLLYHQLFPKVLRHDLGEYYTPDWLAEYLLNEVGYDGNPDTRLLDPACGSGTFLIKAINRVKRWFRERRHECGYGEEGLIRRILTNIVGFDLNPLAVMAARANYLLSLGDLLKFKASPGLPVHLCDSIMTPARVEKVDLVVGNPPWVNWEHLPRAYREATTPLWQRYGLFRHKGYRARLGAGKDDISILMTYVVHDRYLKDEGKLAFVITRSVFKTKGGGEGFRSLRYNGGDGRYYIPIIRVHDLTEIRPFADVSSATALLIAGKTRRPFKYPVPYVTWRRKGPALVSPDLSLEAVIGITTRQRLSAQPVDPRGPASPWLTAPRIALAGMKKTVGKSPYRAHAGCCTWLNGVFWIRILGRGEDGTLTVENLHDVGRIKVQRVRAAIEPDLVHPLLRGRDIRRWHATPSAYMILTNQTDRLAGIPEAEMRSRYPKTYAYLRKFEPRLRKRSGFRLYFKPDAPFYAVYNIGPYSLTPTRVLWRQFIPRPGMACLAKGKDRFLGAKPALTQHVVTFTTFGSAGEAFFFSACGNSSPAALLHRSASAGKSYGQPHMLEMIGIPQYDARDTRHRRLAALAKRCHETSAIGAGEPITELEAEIDEIAAAMWGITTRELKSIQRTLSDTQQT
jgi:hypothetical protein